jgi:hypothetical protein
MSPADDPIFAEIESCKKLDMAWLDLRPILEAAEFEESADLAALRRNHDRAAAAAEKAAWKMARTKPTTAAGAAALLTYITTEPAVGLFDLGEMDRHETAFRNVAASLAKITRQSRRAA